MSGKLLRTGLECQPRDLAILRCLLDSRIATIHHLATLYFEGRVEAARKRVQKLKAAGVMLERPRRSTEPAIYFLTRIAFRLLDQQGVLRDFPNVGWHHLEKRARVSEMTLKHEVEVMDVRSALTAAAERAGHSVAEFATWPKLFQFTAAEPGGSDILVKPDGFIDIRHAGETTDRSLFFLEVDRSTERQETLAMKAACYRDYYLTGGMAARFGRPRSELKHYPFVVLMTFTTAERRNNTAELLLRIHSPIRNQVWLTTLAEVTHDPLGPVWIKPSAYQSLIAQTTYVAPTRPSGPGYRRDAKRDAFVEANIIKHRLLD